MQTALDWIAATEDVDRVILSPQQIAALNAHTFATVDSMQDLAGFPAVLERQRLLEIVRAVSTRPASARHFADGTLLSDTDYSRYEAALNLPAIGSANPVRFGLCVRRSSMRSFPTDDVVYKPDTPGKLDRFQENGLFPADAVAVLHSSKDEQWLLVQSYNYLAWVRSDAIALADREQVLGFRDRAGFAGHKKRDFLVVTVDKLQVTVAHGPDNAQTVQLDMGTRLPLNAAEYSDGKVVNAAGDAQYIVDFPARTESGELCVIPHTLGEQVRCGYLPYTRRNIITQAFQFLGEPYGWGHADNARDCSGLVAEVFRTMGIQLPRNSDEQGRSPPGENCLFSGSDVAAKLQALQTLQVGDLIYTPGHVMLYLGIADSEPWVIHDASTINLTQPDDTYQNDVDSGVAVSPLLRLHRVDGQRQVEAITSLKRIA